MDTLDTFLISLICVPPVLLPHGNCFGAFRFVGLSLEKCRSVLFFATLGSVSAPLFLSSPTSQTPHPPLAAPLSHWSERS